MYTDRSSAPLAFHKFTKYFSLPASIILSICGFIACIDYESWVGIIAMLCLIALQTGAFIGFLKWRDYGITCFLLSIIISGIVCLVLFAYGEVPFSTFIATCVYLVVIVIYYNKRSDLFARKGESESREAPALDAAPKTVKARSNFAHSFRRLFLRLWKYGVVTIVALLFGMMASYIFMQAKVLSLRDEIDELKSKEASDVMEIMEGKIVAYHEGKDSGYRDGYEAAKEEFDEQYEVGYNFAMESAISSMRLYREALQAAIFYNDKQTLSYLMTLDLRGYLIGY